MKITAITVWQCTMPLSEVYWLSGGRLKFEELDSTFVRLDTDEGISGWGESCPWGHTYLPAHGGGSRAALELLAPSVIGLDPRAFASINAVMDKVLPGHFDAKSAIDIACWDIAGIAADMPLWMMFGGLEPAPVAINSSISSGTPDEMIERIKKASAKGYRTHSAKIGGVDPKVDIERIDAISSALPDHESVTFDINRAWTPGVAISVLNTVSARDWIEQPCETLTQCSHVAERVKNPIMLDECLHDFNAHLSAWKHKACEGVKVKPNRVGGLTRAKQIRDFGIEVGWQMHIEDVGGSALADTAAIHLASSTPEANRLASWLCHAHLVDDPVSGQGARNTEGLATPPSTAGLGVVPDENFLGDSTAHYE